MQSFSRKTSGPTIHLKGPPDEQQPSYWPPLQVGHVRAHHSGDFSEGSQTQHRRHSASLYVTVGPAARRGAAGGPGEARRLCGGTVRLLLPATLHSEPSPSAEPPSR